MAESNRQIEWNQNYEQVKDFASSQRRWPSTTAENETEKVLGQWWSRQKYLLGRKTEGGKAPGLTDDRAKLLQSLIESNESLERDGVWEERYSTILNKFKTDNKLWVYATTDPVELKNIRWWNQQKTFARKFLADPSKPHGGMNQERFNRVQELLKMMGQEIDEKPIAPPTSNVSQNDNVKN
jgi:hypothetical protein